MRINISMILQEEYKKNSDLYNKFCRYLEQELNELLRKKDVPYFELHWRIKEWESISEKIERKCLKPHSISDIHDLIGFRVTTLFKRDIVSICDTVRIQLTAKKFPDMKHIPAALSRNGWLGRLNPIGRERDTIW